jgi:ParB family transcriptional regulator, chromosome partitioning protein
LAEVDRRQPQRPRSRSPGAGRPRQAGSGARKRVRDKDADTRAFEKELADALGLKVEIKRGSGESGVMIKYGNFDQLDYIRVPPGES